MRLANLFLKQEPCKRILNMHFRAAFMIFCRRLKLKLHIPLIDAYCRKTCLDKSCRVYWSFFFFQQCSSFTWQKALRMRADWCGCQTWCFFRLFGWTVIPKPNKEQDGATIVPLNSSMKSNKAPIQFMSWIWILQTKPVTAKNSCIATVVGSKLTSQAC